MTNDRNALLQVGTNQDSFANKSASSGHLLTTDALLSDLPRKIKPWGSPHEARGDYVIADRFMPIYYGTGELWYVMDTDTCREVKLPPPPRPAGPPIPRWMEIDRIAEAEAQRHRFVYFVGTLDTAIKIGVSYSAEARLKTIQAHSPIPLNILAVRQGAEATEGAYHDWFAGHRLHGEWFSPASEILKEIDRLNREPQHDR